MTVVLMEMLYTDGGLRQRPAGYLGEIRERDMDDPVRWMLFWAQASAVLDAMEIGVDERKKIERKLRAVIPRPSTYDS